MAYSLTSLVDKVRQTLGGAVAQAPTTLAGLGNRVSSNFNWAGQQAQQGATSFGKTVSQGLNTFDKGVTSLSNNPNPLINFMPKAITSAANANIKYQQAVQSKPVTFSKQGLQNYIDQQRLKLDAEIKTASPVLDVALAPTVGAATYLGSAGIGALFGGGSQMFDNISNKRNILTNVAQSAGYGAQQGLVQAPKISTIAGITNPAINQAAGKVLAKFPNLSEVGKAIVNRVIQGSLSIPEGMAMAKATGQDYSITNAAIDFAVGSGLARKAGTMAIDGPYGNGKSGMVGNPRYIHPDDYKLYDQANTIIHEKGKFTPAEIAKAADDLRLLGEKYLPVADQPVNGNPILLANRLTKRMASGALPTSGDVGAVKLDEPIGGSAKKYYVADVAKVDAQGKSIFEEVKGKPVKIFDGVDTFLYKNKSGEWTVTEARTGAKLSSPMSTEKAAIESARELVKKNTKNDMVALKKKIEDVIQIRGESPTYGESQKPIGKVSSDTQSPQMKNQQVDQTIAKSEVSPIQKSKPKERAIPSELQVDQTQKLAGITSQQQSQSTLVGQSSDKPYFNTNRLSIDDNSKAIVDKTISEIKPQIEAKVGKKLSNKEVVETANATARTLNSAVTREQTMDWERALLKTRQKLAAMSQSGAVDQEYIDTLLAVKTSGTDIARKLQSFSIGADPKNVTAKEAILDAVLKVEKDATKLLDASKGVDFNDYTQATEFYRRYVKPSYGDWLDTLRYNSMLSSPNTHINNAVSNYQGSGIIAPIEKTITGIVDKIASSVTGKPRSYYTGEGAAYAKGYYSNLKQATSNFLDVMSGKNAIENFDTRSIPMANKGIRGGLEKALVLPMRLLEASDQFFTALTEGGSRSALEYRASKSGIGIDNIDQIAADEAAKRLFRSTLGENNGSAVLNAIDTLANTVQGLKNSKSKIVSTMAKFTLPFLRTPTNILKQGVEYSPLGLTTLAGSSTKTEQISKAILGSSVAAATALLVSSDRLTWAEPTSDKQKQMFRAAGMQPYSVKVGDTWVSYSKLHPAISFNIALVAAVKHSRDDKKLSESEAETVLNGLAKWLNFYVDQSYMKNIGDFVAGVKGDVEGMAKIPANYIQQALPYRALLSWVARLTDPYQRKVDPDGSILDKQLQQIASQIPLLSQSVPARLDQNGKPIENQSRILNAVSPARISTEKQPLKQEYEDYINKLKKNRAIKDATSGVGYVQSKDAPQNIIDVVGTYGKSVITDPGQTINAVLAGNPIRKVDGGAVILERKNGLGAIDKGNKATQVDHIIALTLGGTNSKDNLQVLTKEENMIKGQVESNLYRLMKSGQITKEEAQKRDLNWKDEVNSLPKNVQEQLVTELSTPTAKATKQSTLKIKAPKVAKAKSTGTKATKGKRITVKMGKVPKIRTIKIKRFTPKAIKIKPLKLKKYTIKLN